MTHLRSSIALSLLLSLFAPAGCSTEDGVESVSPGSSCTPGKSSSCLCSGDRKGTKTCRSDGTFGVCKCGATQDGDPEATAGMPSRADTTHLDPLGGTGGNVEICLRPPPPTFFVTQGQHQNDKAIDLGCDLGDTLINPFPAIAKVTDVITRFSNTVCYESGDAYNKACKGSPDAAAACNNKLKLQTTIGGVTWTAWFLHIQGSDLKVGDEVAPFAPVARCGAVGWTCDGTDAYYPDPSLSAHLHFALERGSSFVYSESYFSSACSAVASSEGCQAGSTCCDSKGKFVQAGTQGAGCNSKCQTCNGNGGCIDQCTPSCLGGDGTYCGGTVGLDPGKLYQCTAGTYTEIMPCPNGCHVAKVGDPDSCESAPSSGTCAAAVVCGSQIGKDASTVYTCSGGVYSVKQTCPDGCSQGVCTQPSTSFCSGKPDGKRCDGADLVTCIAGAEEVRSPCPAGCANSACKTSTGTGVCAGQEDGTYCDGNDLVTCGGGNEKARNPCPNGCSPQAPGTPDFCAPTSGGFCAGKDPGDYCDGDDLVTCQGGSEKSRNTCPKGCSPQAPGTPDVCASGGSSGFCAGKDPGDYCDNDDLVTCQGGSETKRSPCPNGCSPQAPGTPDVCASGGSSGFCAGKAGYYCDGDDLVTCTSGSESARFTCPNGCAPQAPGTPDVCK